MFEDRITALNKEETEDVYKRQPFLTGAFSNYVSIIIYDFSSKFYFHPKYSSVHAVSNTMKSL